MVLRARDCDCSSIFVHPFRMILMSWWSSRSIEKNKHCNIFSHSLYFWFAVIFLGADAKFLVRLRLSHRYDIHIGYFGTATYWLSGTRSCGKYFSMHSNYSFAFLLLFLSTRYDYYYFFFRVRVCFYLFI